MNYNENLDIIIINRQEPTNETAYNTGFAKREEFRQAK